MNSSIIAIFLVYLAVMGFTLVKISDVVNTFKEVPTSFKLRIWREGTSNR